MADKKAKDEPTSDLPQVEGGRVDGGDMPNPGVDAEVAVSPEQQKMDEEREAALEAAAPEAVSAEDAAEDADDLDTPHSTAHIPNFGQTHATPGVPFSENPLNPGMSPVIIPGPAPRD